MPEAGLKVVHISPRVQGRGGIETLHEYHRLWRGEQVFVALFDRQPEARTGYLNLNFSWRVSLAEMRRRFREALAPYRGAIVIYHNAWGLPLFHDLDGAARRVVFLHASPVYHADHMRAVAGLVDGAIGVTPALAPAWTELWPELTKERTTVVRAPIQTSPDLVRSSGGRKAGAPWVLGFAGRIEKSDKRLDRLPGLIRELQARKIAFRFEVLGEGPLRRELEASLGGAVRFHGWVSREDFWRLMAGWDAMVFFSDTEGGPIALFEGMSLGLVPFYPSRGGSWGDVYAPQVDPRCHYPPGDMTTLAEAIREISARSEEKVAVLRHRSKTLVESHRQAEYDASCLALIEKVRELPRLSAERARPNYLTDKLPLGVVTRWAMPALLRA